MPLDPHAQRLLAMLDAAGAAGPAPLGLAERRQALANLMRLAGAPASVGTVVDATVPGPAGPIPLRRYAPRRPTDDPAPGVIFLHGGGLVAGSLDTHDPLCRNLVDATSCPIVSVGYRLAPEAPFPAAFEDALAATRAILAGAGAFGLDPARIAVGGDSAGGGLAAAVARALAGGPGPALRTQLLLCPVLDAVADTPSRGDFARGFLLDAVLMARDLADIGAPDLSDLRLSPLRGHVPAGLPPALIHTAEFDPVRDEGEAYAEKLSRAGVPVRHTRHAGMVHHFYALTGAIPRARAALRVIGDEVRRILEA